jgi:hypothetical protein
VAEPELAVIQRPSLLRIAGDLLHLSYSEGVPDGVSDEMRRTALLLRDEHDRGRRVEKLTPSRQRNVKVCPVCGTDCPTCLRPPYSGEATT